MTYRFLSFLTQRSIDGVVVLGDVQIQEMVVWEILLTLGTTVHVHLLIMNIILVKGAKGERLVRRQ